MADLIECAVADDVKEFVIAAAQHVNEASGTSYHVSDVMSCEDAGEGGKKLKLVMCSGDECAMKTVTVVKTGSGFSVTVEKGGMF